MRESKDRERENIEFFFFGLSDFYLFFTIFRKIKNIIKRVFWKKGKFEVFITTTHQKKHAHIVDDVRGVFG